MPQYDSKLHAISNDASYSYNDIQNYVAKAVSHLSAVLALRINCEKRQPRIIVGLPDKIQNMIAIYACVALDATYIPLDLQQPISRIESILANIQPDLIFCPKDIYQWANPYPTISWQNIEDAEPTREINLNEILDKKNADLNQIMAILFTSGSTGIPKGIAISYRSIITFIDAMITTFDLRKGDRIASLAPFHFDLSFFDLFASLRAGASVYFVPDQLKMSPFEFISWINENRITHIYTVPSFLKMLILKGKIGRFAFEDLKAIMFAGECFPLKYVLLLAHLLPNTRLFNLFGPTETNVCCYWELDRDKIHLLDEVPIGKPLRNSEITIDPESNELLVRGPQLMSGYLINGELTHQQSPENWYRTGDHVVLGPEDNLLFRGRLDKMIKRNGYRIELQEIESQIMAHPCVQEAHVWAVKKTEVPIIFAAAAVGEYTIEAKELKQWLSMKVPSYMEVDKIILYQHLPQLSNGKKNLIEIEKISHTN